MILYVCSHQVVELEKKLLRMEIRLRDSSRAENYGIGKSAVPSISSGLDGVGLVDVGESSNEELQLEQYYPNDSACRCASDCSLRDSDESTNHYKNNAINAGYGSCELHSLSSPECYSPCSYSTCLRRQQRIRASPPNQEDKSCQVYGRSPSRCFQKRENKLPRPDNGDPNESQARQWLHETTRFELSASGFVSCLPKNCSPKQNLIGVLVCVCVCVCVCLCLVNQTPPFPLFESCTSRVCLRLPYASNATFHLFDLCTSCVRLFALYASNSSLSPDPIYPVMASIQTHRVLDGRCHHI
jgi:hypothetical protein